jgi:hypothetical protein
VRKLVASFIGLALGLSLSGCSSSNGQPKTDGGGSDTAARLVNCTGDCTFTATYTISTDGFFANSADKAVLSPAQAYQHLAYHYQDAGTLQSTSCAPAIPPCTGGDPVSACDIAQDLADPVVQAALAQATLPFYGRDDRPTDGTAFSFKRDDGHGFEVGAGSCGSASACTPVPAAIARLKADLQKLDGALILTAECAALNAQLHVAGSQ